MTNSNGFNEVSTSFTLPQKDTEKALDALQNEINFSEFFNFTWKSVAIIYITGVQILQNETKGSIFFLLARENILVHAISQNYNELRNFTNLKFSTRAPIKNVINFTIFI